MNVENVTKLRDFLASLPAENFDMGEWPADDEAECGTPACIGGWATRLFGSARRALEIDNDTAEAMFMPKGWDQPKSPVAKARPAHAVALLTRFLKTGKVDWHYALLFPTKPEGAQS